MNVVMISPGYPAEMAFFARGLADADDRGPGGGEAAGEQGHLGRVPG